VKAPDQIMQGVQIQNADRSAEGLGLYFDQRSTFGFMQSRLAFQDQHPLIVDWIFKNYPHQGGDADAQTEI
jgi:hypothetical protein